uniref:Uncharacterized protein n=1 Tax=viral metagenome TaxID=1070528 RepID=A0A6M3LU09_9ZZZZ
MEQFKKLLEADLTPQEARRALLDKMKLSRAEIAKEADASESLVGYVLRGLPGTDTKTAAIREVISKRTGVPVNVLFPEAS